MIARFLSIFILFLISCNNKEKPFNRTITNTQILSNFNGECYSIEFDINGHGIVKKGESSQNSEIFKIENVSDSVTIHIDSAYTYFEKIEHFKKKPYRSAKMLGAYHVLIYTNDSLVFNSYRFNSDFWDLIKVIGEDIPIDYNPFMHDISQ